MAETLTTVRADLRTELKDTDASNYRWTDDELDRHVERAVDRYSRTAPREMKSTKATVASSRELDISTGYDDLVKVFAVEYPVDKFPKRYQRFSFWNDIITLVGDDVPDGSNAYIYWGKVHTLDVSTNTIPDHHLPIVMTGAKGFAVMAWGQYAVNRVNVGGAGTPREYLRWGDNLLVEFNRELRRLRSKLRQAVMYAPYHPIKSQSTDWGP